MNSLIPDAMAQAAGGARGRQPDGHVHHDGPVRRHLLLPADPSPAEEAERTPGHAEASCRRATKSSPPAASSAASSKSATSSSPRDRRQRAHQGAALSGHHAGAEGHAQGSLRSLHARVRALEIHPRLARPVVRAAVRAAERIRRRPRVADRAQGSRARHDRTARHQVEKVLKDAGVTYKSIGIEGGNIDGALRRTTPSSCGRATSPRTRRAG